MPVIANNDLTAASYSVALFGLAATSVLLLYGVSFVQRGWKWAVLLCALAALVGVGADYEGRAALIVSGKSPVVYQYVGWVVSIPLQVIALYFFANQVGTQRIGLFWRLAIVAILMVFVRYLGEADYMQATLAFLIGLVFWLYILGELYFGLMDETISRSSSEPVRIGYFWLRLIVTIGWAIYPLGNFITAFGGYADTGALTITYNLADIINRMAFGAAVLASALMASEEKRQA